MIDTIEYDYPTFHLSIDCFLAEIVNGKLILKEAEAARWLTKEQLYSVDWLPVDVTIIEKIVEKCRWKRIDVEGVLRDNIREIVKY